jgi:hypothetical protein
MAQRRAGVESVERSMSTLKEITACEVCGGSTLRPALDLGPHPLCDDLIPIGSPEISEVYPIEILICERCITAHQRFQIQKEILFPKTYHYRAKHTADVQNGMKRLVEDLVSFEGNLSGKLVLDVGCNDGSLLNYFRDAGARTYGIEPTDAAKDAASAGHVVQQSFFTRAAADQFISRFGIPDIITFTNVFAHIDDLSGLVQTIKAMIGPSTTIVIENHYFGSILERNQFDTFYHEHPRTYSASSFIWIARSLGMDIRHFSFPARYGGNIRVLLGRGSLDPSLPSITSSETLFSDRLMGMASGIELWRSKKSKIIHDLTAKRPMVAKAFPGRAAIPLKLLGLDVDRIECVYEKAGSSKIGHYVPGTRIPIRSDNDFESKSTRTLLNLAWHISEEIETYMRSRGFSGHIIDIMAPSDLSES